MARDLTLLQTSFLSSYLGVCHGIGWRAAKEAGYTGNEGVLRVTACRLLTNPNISARIALHKAAIESEGIANRTERVRAQNARWEALERIRVARAEDPTMQDIPGGTTGFIVRSYKVVGTTVREEYTFDKAHFDAYEDLEQHTAKELGQVLPTKTEVTGKDGSPLIHEHQPPNPADVVAVLGALSRAGALGGVPGPGDLQPRTPDSAPDGLPADQPV